jgi:hypothetical protein
MIRIICIGLLAVFVAMEAASTQALAQQQQRKPNILVIMGDDVGQSNALTYIWSKAVPSDLNRYSRKPEPERRSSDQTTAGLHRAIHVSGRSPGLPHER